MAISKSQLIAALSPPLPLEIVEHLLDEYIDMKQHFALGKFRPNELTGGRFAESIARLIEYFDAGTYTPYGTSSPPASIFDRAQHLSQLHDSVRLYIPRISRMLLDVRNRRDVAHAGGDVSPNYSDAVFVTHMADWTMTELIRVYFNCPIDAAKQIVDTLNETHVPIVEDVDGFLKVLNTNLDTRDTVLAILYHKTPLKLKDTALIQWTKYSNPSRFKTQILAGLDKEALVHYDKEGYCSLTRKGILHVEKYIPLTFSV